MSTLVEKYGRAELGIDGNCAYALLGPDLQEGEAEFVEVADMSDPRSQADAARRALQALRMRLNEPSLSYYLGSSHPFYA